MQWDKEKFDWPHHELSNFIDSETHTWHVQDTNKLKTKKKKLPIALFIHGAGASTHSWRLILDQLKDNFRVILVDLPGHGFSRLGKKNRSSLEAITKDLEFLLIKMNVNPNLVIGHSAGAAVALNLALSKKIKIQGILCLNGALGNFSGIAGILYPLLAKFLSMSPLTVPFFTSLYSSKNQVEKFLSLTGSKINPKGIIYYKKLISDKKHVEGTLAMMSQWNLNQLILRLKQIEIPVCLIVGQNDNIVENHDNLKASKDIPKAEFISNPEHGHLMHEENPELISDQIKSFYIKSVSIQIS